MIERVELAPGYEVPRLINGAWQLSAGHRKGAVDRRRALTALRRLAETGLTAFDCADIYLGVEELLGELISQLGRAGAGAPEIRIHTKYVPDRSALATLGRRDVERAVDRSLERLGVERLDLVQFHWWDYGVPRYLEVAGWLDELRRAGKIRLLGTTNFDPCRLGELLAAGIPLATHQAQYSLLDRRPERGMVELCRRYGVAMLCYGAVAGGFLAQRYLGRCAPREPLANRSLVKYRLIIEEFGGWALLQELLERLAAIGRRHGVSPTTAALRWVLDRPGVAAAIVGVRDACHLEENLQVFGVRLEERDLADLEEVLARAPGPPGDPYALERTPGGRHQAIMKTDLNRQRRSG